MALLYERTGRLVEARAAARRSAEVARAAAGPGHVKSLEALTLLGRLADAP